MHDNRRYVKLAWIGLLSLLSLAVPGQAKAELVTIRAEQGVLAVAADGTPFVGYSVGRDLHLAARSSGRWRSIRLGRLPGRTVALAGIRISERPHRLVSILAEDTAGRWIALARGSKVTTIARAARGSRFGPAGLTLDARQRPAIAYAVQRPSQKTFLRLVTLDQVGRTHTRAVTQEGFPSSSLPPGAAPVLVDGRLHVVETYTSSAIDWGPKPGGGWEGQFLFTSVMGSPTGRVGAVFTRSTLFAAWTQWTPELGPDELAVLLTTSTRTQETVRITHGAFVCIVDGGGWPEMGANDWIDLTEGWREYAALVVLGPKEGAWQLDGRLEGYSVAPAGSRHLLLHRDQGLEWFRTPGPLPGIGLRMSVDESGKVAGSVDSHTAGGMVEIYREVPHAARELVASAPVALDSSFSTQVPPATSGTVYRGVYADPGTGLPFAALPGVPVGVTG